MERKASLHPLGLPESIVCRAAHSGVHADDSGFSASARSSRAISGYRAGAAPSRSWMGRWSFCSKPHPDGVHVLVVAGRRPGHDAVDVGWVARRLRHPPPAHRCPVVVPRVAVGHRVALRDAVIGEVEGAVLAAVAPLEEVSVAVAQQRQLHAEVDRRRQDALDVAVRSAAGGPGQLGVGEGQVVDEQQRLAAEPVGAGWRRLAPPPPGPRQRSRKGRRRSEPTAQPASPVAGVPPFRAFRNGSRRHPAIVAGVATRPSKSSLDALDGDTAAVATVPSSQVRPRRGPPPPRPGARRGCPPCRCCPRGRRTRRAARPCARAGSSPSTTPCRCPGPRP